MNLERKELVAGALAFVVAVGAFCFIGLTGRGRTDSQMYTLSARFNQTDGLIVGNEVRLAGIRIGRVTELKLDEHYGVVVNMTLPESVRLPDDSAAAVQSTGLIGSKYIELQPGGSEDMLEDGGFIEFTQDSPNLQNLLDKVIAMAKSKRDAKKR